ncbi:MAG: response regulator [Spartobacteria bacterium]|nr:response regulator [Spartobacteria bacterium]
MNTDKQSSDPAVLIVDDSIIACKVLSKTLAPFFDKIIYRTSADGIKDCILQDHVNCLVLDLLMPETSGYDVIESVLNWRPGFPIIVVSADIQEETRRHCDKMGIFAYFNKPAPTDDLVESIREAMLKYPQAKVVPS